MARLTGFITCVLCLAACASTGPDESAVQTTTPSVMATATAASPSTEATSTLAPSATPEQSEPAEPRELTGTWRTTLGGEPLSLTLTESTYRIVRGSNAANGSVAVTGDLIEFFDSDLCPGTAVYRWTIGDGLTFFPVETEPCTGRAEALLVRYTDYSPPEDG